MNDQHQVLVEQAVSVYRDVARSWTVPAALTWLALDLSIAQVKALIALACEEPLTVSQVGDLLGIGLPTASHLVERLVQAELAERSEDPADRRRTLVRLSQNGRDLSQRLWFEGRDQLQHRFSLLSQDDLSALLQGLRAVVAAADDESSERWSPFLEASERSSASE